MTLNGKRRPAFSSSSSLLIIITGFKVVQEGMLCVRTTILLSSVILLSVVSTSSFATGLSSETSNITTFIFTPEVNSLRLSTEPPNQKLNLSYSANNSQFRLMDSETGNRQDTTTMTLHIILSDGDSTASQSTEVACKLKAIDARISDKILSKISNEQINLLEYQLTFPNYSVNPLSAISWHVYRLDSWARASSRHGQTLLSLLFNYGILSLRTLTFGTDLLTVELEDIPDGCVTGLNETQVVAQLLFLLSRDFKDTADEVLLKGEERICHEIIVDADGYAKFTDQCFQKGTNGELVETQAGNFWINFLYILLTIVRFGILFFGPLLLTSAVARMSNKSIPYVVKLKDVLRKTVLLTSNKTEASNLTNSENPKLLDLTNLSDQDFPKFKESIENLPRDEAIEVQISQYDIMVDYKRLLTENRVPVSLWKSLGRMIFLCKIRKVGPFKRCCEADVLKSCPCKGKRPTPCSYIWRKVGVVLLIVCIPTPWYLRLWVFYAHEYSEVLSRKEATAKLGLKEGFDNSLIHYFTPEHWLFRCIYVLYGVSAFVLAYVARRGDDSGFRRIVTGSFADLESLSWIRVLEMLVGNVIWPFERYGLCGLFVVCVYWPVVVPLSLIVFILYILPLTYLVIRMLFYPTQEASQDRNEKESVIRFFETSFYSSKDKDSKHQVDRKDKCKVPDGVHNDVRVQRIKRFCVRSLASVLCILSLVSYLIIMSECIGCTVEILVFTLMGIIVNAGTLLKYVSLLILVIVYSYDSFNNVEKKYLKLNKALFSEVKSRIKDLDKVTSLPSHLQENRGFKSQELSEQGEYELPDDLEVKPSHHLHWVINDLVLFVDNEDMPRIPKELFDEVCQIRVAGVPGPIYRGLLFGVRQFLKIALFISFVFIVVLSFGDVYKISSTNQMLATLAGGFLPVILRQFMEPERPDIEIGTVSFKSKLDEIIKNFKQRWPIHDFPLEKAIDDQNKASEKEQNAVDDETSYNRIATEETNLLNKEAEAENKRNNSQWNAGEKASNHDSAQLWKIKVKEVQEKIKGSTSKNFQEV